MRVRLALSALLACSLTLAEQTLTLGQLLAFIRSSIQLKQQDREVAAYISKIRLSEKLDGRIVEELQGEGAGPKTVAALNDLASASASLPQHEVLAPKPPLVTIPPPSPEEQETVIHEVRDYAMNYSRSLPDFICTQVTRRFVDPTGLEFWQGEDTITARLSYFEQKENYKLVLVNDRYVDLPYDSVGGATSSGEFGSLLRETLDRRADALIEFDHWGTLRGKRAYVFAYRISSGSSHWSIRYERLMRIITGYKGLIYVDKDTHRILRITLEAVDIPHTFPIQEARTVMDYDYVKIGDRDYLLPLKAVVRMRHNKLLTRNDVEFRLYRKFSTEVEIKFDTPDPFPEDQTK